MLLRIDWFDVEAQYRVYAPPARKLSVMRIGPDGGLSIGRMIAAAVLLPLPLRSPLGPMIVLWRIVTLAAQHDWMPSPRPPMTEWM